LAVNKLVAPLGSDGWMTLIRSVSQPIGITCVDQEGVMVDPKGSKGAPARGPCRRAGEEHDRGGHGGSGRG
jgi:hypothetical protein